MKDQHSPALAALPIPTQIVDQLSMRYHVALESMKVGKGSAAAAQALLEMVIATGLLADCGCGRLDHQLTRKAEAAIASATRDGIALGTWKLSGHGFQALCSMVTEHDEQLSSATAKDAVRVLEGVRALSQWAEVTASSNCKQRE
ncbi:hypothetical protein [Paraburkholderia terrae]|nr:hypothetical protein [Paraburkholderia terrae]